MRGALDVGFVLGATQPHHFTKVSFVHLISMCLKLGVLLVQEDELPEVLRAVKRTVAEAPRLSEREESEEDEETDDDDDVSDEEDDEEEEEEEAPVRQQVVRTSVTKSSYVSRGNRGESDDSDSDSDESDDEA